VEPGFNNALFGMAFDPLGMLSNAVAEPAWIGFASVAA
jgi:hypothetical protein